jgi:tetratricopeptide (TPR) repeat protein
LVPKEPSPLAQAEEALQRGEYREAVAFYELAAAEGKIDIGARDNWARALVGAERVDDALQLYDEASAELGENPTFLTGWGTFLASLGMHEQARWRFEQAISHDEKHVPAYLGAGRLLLALGLPHEAAERFKKVAEELDEENAVAFGGWAQACEKLGDYEGAMEKLRRAIDLDKEMIASLDYWREIGGVLYELKRLPDALKAYDKAILLEQTFGSTPSQEYLVRYGAASAALALKLPDRAGAHCRDGLERLKSVGLKNSSPAASLHYLYGSAQAMLKRYADAIVSFRRASKASGAFAVYAMNAIAGTLTAQGRYEEAWEELGGLEDAHQRVEAAPDPSQDDEQLSAYGTALTWLDRLDKAEEAFTGALGPLRRNASAWAKLMAIHLERAEQSSDEEENRWQWEAYEAYRKTVGLLEEQCKERRDVERVLGLGLLHLQMEEFEQAQPLLEEASRLDGEEVTCYAGLGMALAGRGKHAEAVEQLRHALRRDPDNLIVKCHLADAYFRLGRHDAALDAYDKVLRIASGNVGAHIGAGEILIELAEDRGDDLLYEDAELHFSKAIKLAKSVRPGSPDREGSSGLGMRQWADLYYSRGYARVKMCQSQIAGPLGRLTRAGRERLEGALKDFEQARDGRSNPSRTDRAVECVREALRQFSRSALSERHASLAVAGIAFALLLLVQVAFVAAGGFSNTHTPLPYVSLTVSLVVLVAVGFYLPQVLKLKFGGIELEKAAAEQASGVALDVHREPFQAKLHSVLEPPVPRSRKVEHEGERFSTRAREDARQGAEVV